MKAVKFQKPSLAQRGFFRWSREVLMMVLVSICLPLSAQEQDSQNLQDPETKMGFYDQQIEPFLQRAIDPTSQVLFLSGAAASFASRSFDDSIRDQFKDHQKMDKDTSHLGDLLGTGAVGLVIAGGQLYLDPWQGQNHLRSILTAGTMTYLLKYTFGRNRPGSSHSHHSFPSGHTSTAFATATALSYAYGWKVGIPAYALAAFTGASRWSDDAHWFSDVVGGAFVGIWMARASCFPEEQKSSSKNSFLKLDRIFKYWTWYPTGGGIRFMGSF